MNARGDAYDQIKKAFQNLIAGDAGAGDPGPSQPEPATLSDREGLDGVVYVRVGCTNRRADRPLIEELRRFARGEGFDEQPLPELDSEALDFRAASESLAPVRKLGRHDLETLRLVSNFETENAKLIQIIIAGQPQLARKLASPGQEQLRQRLSTIARIEALSLSRE